MDVNLGEGEGKFLKAEDSEQIFEKNGDIIVDAVENKHWETDNCRCYMTTKQNHKGK